MSLSRLSDPVAGPAWHSCNKAPQRPGQCFIIIVRVQKMASPATTQPMVFTPPSNASQMLYPENTSIDYRIELPSHMVLIANDYNVALASITYPHMWYNVPMDQAHRASFMFLPDHEHVDNDKKYSKRHCMGTTFVRGHRMLPLATTTASGPSWPKWMTTAAKPADLHIQPAHPSDCVIVAFRPGLKQCMGQVGIIRALSLLLGWPDEVIMLTGQGNMCIRAPSSSMR